MVILIKTYRLHWSPYWLGGSGHTRWRVGGLVADCQQWVVISNWELTKVEDYVNG